MRDARLLATSPHNTRTTTVSAAASRQAATLSAEQDAIDSSNHLIEREQVMSRIDKFVKYLIVPTIQDRGKVCTVVQM